MIVIVDYGLGNLGSVANMLKKIGAKAMISSIAGEIANASGLVLPGVGHFDTGMRHLRERGLVDLLHDAVITDRKPILGICLGMQLFSKGSEEGSATGLGWINATTEKFRFDGDEPLPVPHMGWNETASTDEVLFAGMTGPGNRFYFVHSYHVVCAEPADVAATCSYGSTFIAAVRVRNIFGTQFHPEKSHRFGMRILQNFVAQVPHA